MDYMKYIIISTSIFLFICHSLFSQNDQVFIPSNVLDTDTDVSKYCNLLSKKENLDRKTIYNLANNGIIARNIQNNNLEYTQVLKNHMLLKLFSDSFFNCPRFAENYHFIFDAGNSGNTELVAQHKLFTSKLIEYIKGDNSILRLTDTELPIFGYLDHLNNSDYTLSFYYYLPESGPVVPNELSNRFANYTFRIDNNSIVIIDKEVDEKEIVKLTSKNLKVTPPPPPPMPKRN